MNLYWEIDERRFVAGLSDPRILNLIEMPAGDIVPIRVYIVERSSVADPFTTQAITTGHELLISAKETASNGTTLFTEDDFSETEVGSYTYYAGDLNLNTEEIVAACSGKNTLTVLMEIAWKKTADDSQRYSTTIRLKLHNNVNDSASIPTAVDDNAKFIDGVLHIKNQTTGEWHPIKADGGDGQEHLDVGDGVAG